MMSFATPALIVGVPAASVICCGDFEFWETSVWVSCLELQRPWAEGRQQLRDGGGGRSRALPSNFDAPNLYRQVAGKRLCTLSTFLDRPKLPGSTCSNGLPGIDGANDAGDNTCCPVQCNQCGMFLTRCCPRCSSRTVEPPSILVSFSHLTDQKLFLIVPCARPRTTCSSFMYAISSALLIRVF